MLGAVVAVVALVLVVAGVAIMIGPATARQTWARARGRPASRERSRRRRPSGQTTADLALHPTAQKAVILSARIASLLRAQGRDAFGADLKKAIQRLRLDETAGLYALLTATRSLRDLSLEQPDADRELQRLVGELRQAVRDRAEQLELLPFH